MGTPVGNEAGQLITDQDITPAFLAQSLQPNIYAACIVVTVAATVAVAFRLLCRRLAKAYLWWGTYLVELSLPVEYWFRDSSMLWELRDLFTPNTCLASPFSCLESAMNADFEIE